MRTEILVVGAGSLGLVFALRARQKFKKAVTVLHSQRQGIHFPYVDSLRNHSWLQSGVLYPKLATPGAASMWWSGRQLHELAGFPLPTTRGVFRVDDRGAEELVRTAIRLGLRHEVIELTDREARYELRDLYVGGGSRHYGVPDTPFDEAGILRALHTMAVDAGVKFRSASVRSLIYDDQSRAGISVATDWGPITADFVVLCAGASLPDLLDGIHVPHQLQVFQSCLFTIKNNRYLRTSLLADRTTDLSIVRHQVAPGVLPAGAVVVGGRGRRRIINLSEPRMVYPRESVELIRLLPECMQAAAFSSGAIAGYKVEAIEADGRTTVRPHVSHIPGFDRVIYAVPGKATFAYLASDWILDRLSALIGNSRFHLNRPAELGVLPTHFEAYEMHHTADVDETVEEPKREAGNEK